MDTEIIKAVLTEVLDELREVKQLIAGQQQANSEIASKIEALEQKLVAPRVDTVPIQAMIDKSISQVKAIVADLPKNVVHQKRILLFPEYDAAGYYRLVFGRLLFWLMLFVGATYLFSLGRQGLQSWKEVREKEAIVNQYKAAWEYFYKSQGKAGKKKLQEVWQKAAMVLSDKDQRPIRGF